MADLAEDPRFASFAARLEHRQALLDRLWPRILELPTEEWLSRLKGKVPCAPVRDLPGALHAEELERRGMLASYNHPRLGEVRSVGLPLRVSGFTPTYRASPALGADAADLLTELGFDDSDVARLKEAGAFGL
jgi:crotonobetainyl-CoA:carnitine CoA-transferase CaiB-like acyl-CoA transferase